MNGNRWTRILKVLQGETPRVLAHPFGTPLIARGWTWLPLAQVATWLALAATWAARPGRSWAERLGAAALATPFVLGSEWGHNLAHAAAARAIGKPMDELRIYAGMPRVVYHELNDLSLAPIQHVQRALAGPLFSGAVWGLACLLRRLFRRGSLARQVADAAAGMNAMIALSGLLPIPALDGGAVLKWGLVGRGCSVPQADGILRRLNAGLSQALGAASLLAWRRRNRFASGMLGMLALIALGIASGKIVE
jgi:hypothetical protein